ncbi:hypothetical protein QYF36_008162 [Acer negundo]|nr:hypothetical protein QYF36_008162 [Acer negundo]
MLLFRVHLKYADRVVDMDLIEPGDCSIVNLINDAKKVLSGHHVNIEANNEEDNVVLVKENGEEENVCGHVVNDGSDKCSVDNEYEISEELEDDLDMSLVDENGEKDFGNKDHYGQIIGNATFTREVMKRYAIQKGFTLKKIKNDRSVRGSRSMCLRVAENKEATSRGANRASFEQALALVREKSENAANWLMLEPVEKWARHAFELSLKADHVSDNMSKCFNSWENLTMNEKEARKLQVIHGRGRWFETVDQADVKILVNTDDGTCDYGMWQMNELPCMHDIIVFMYNK